MPKEKDPRQDPENPLETKIHLSPFVLSSVMFDNSNSMGDQEGFLIGHCQQSVRQEISDSSMNKLEKELIISIYSCVPCGSYLSFYDSLGNVNERYVNEFLGDRKKFVVGWYRYRRNLVAFPSSREMIIQKNLMKLFLGTEFVDYFVLSVLGSACYPTTATHTYDYAFFNQRDESFKSLPISLLNLGDTKTQYRGGSLSGSFIKSDSFNEILGMEWDFSSSWQTEDAVHKLHTLCRAKSHELAGQVAATDSVNVVLEQEVQSLDAELRSLTFVEPDETNNNEADLDDSENIPPEKITLPLSNKHGKLLGKRPLKDIIDLNEELHPLYGKFFPQNRAQEPGSSHHFSGEMTGINYNFLPPKKKIKVILQERRRILDHDYEIGSDEDPPQQFVPETDEESSESIETGGYLSSDAAGYLQEEETPGPSSRFSRGKEDEEAKVKVVYLDGRATNADVHCAESVAEEVVETMVPETSDSELSSAPNSPSDAGKKKSCENVASPKACDKDGDKQQEKAKQGKAQM